MRGLRNRQRQASPLVGSGITIRIAVSISPNKYSANTDLVKFSEARFGAIRDRVLHSSLNSSSRSDLIDSRDFDTVSIRAFMTQNWMPGSMSVICTTNARASAYNWGTKANVGKSVNTV